MRKAVYVDGIAAGFGVQVLSCKAVGVSYFRIVLVPSVSLVESVELAGCSGWLRHP